MTMPGFNPFAEYTEVECVSTISFLAAQLGANASAVNTPTGGAQIRADKETERKIYLLRCRLAELRGLAAPVAPTSMIPRRTIGTVRVEFDAGYGC